VKNSPFASFKWEALFNDKSLFLKGFLTTIQVSMLALIFALILGLIFGILGSSHNKILKRINKIYVSFFQNTPLVIQIFFIFNGLPYFGITLPVFAVGVIGIGIYHGAYMAEVIRGGIEAVPKGQMEASISQGFNYMESMIHIIIPQAIKFIFPPLTNQVVNLIKNTSVMAMIAGGDLMYQADSWSSNNLYYGPAYIVTGILYLMLCLPLAIYAKKLEGKAEV
jgi:putative glutamine transport system permease protein